MYLTIAILTTATFGGLTVYANPLPFAKGSSSEGPSIAVKRQSADRICGDRNAYSSSYQARVFQAAQSYDLTGNGGVQGSNNVVYPHRYNNREDINFPDCAGVPAPYQEFPILADGRMFGAVGKDDPQTDRIVYKITSHSPVTGLPDNFAYCGVMTHIGAPDNSFVICPDA